MYADNGATVELKTEFNMIAMEVITWVNFHDDKLVYSINTNITYIMQQQNY